MESYKLIFLGETRDPFVMGNLKGNQFLKLLKLMKLTKSAEDINEILIKLTCVSFRPRVPCLAFPTRFVVVYKFKFLFALKFYAALLIPVQSTTVLKTV